MSVIINWIEAHPTIFALILWPTLTAILTSIFSKPSDAFAAKWPRIAAIRRIPSDAGINLPKLLANVLVILTGKAAATPSIAPTLFPDEQPTKKEGRSIPPLPVLFLMLALVSCAATAAMAYRKQQEACVRDSKTLEESRECRAKVRHEWGTDLEPTITVSDAGADHAAE